MRHLKMSSIVGLALVLAKVTPAAGQIYGSQCSGKYSCGPEIVIGTDDRIKPVVSQPLGEPGKKAACGGEISASLSYGLQILPLTCGEGALSHDRLPTPVKESIMDRWDELSRSGLPDAREKMQKLRQLDLKYEGEIEYPVYESWTYQMLVGNFDPRCGMESWMTTCQRTREETYEVEETDYGNCLERAADPVAPPSSSGDYGGSSSSGSSTYHPEKSPVDRSLPGRGSGSGESRKDINDAGKRGYDQPRAPRGGSRRGSSILPIDMSRMPAGECLRYGKHWVSKTRPLSPITYSCLKQRPQYCTWYETRTVTRRCENQKAKYVVQYTKDPRWTPAYTDPKLKHRDYNDVLPNKFDLLVGETENITVFNNLGTSSSMTPAVKITSPWNDYRTVAKPSQIRCELGKTAQFEIEVVTLGRNKTKAPNPLALPVDENGQKLSPLKIENGRPVQVSLMDTGRSTQLSAAANSRAFPRPEGAAKAEADAIHKKAKIAEGEVAGLQGGYWHETRFRLQLTEKGRWGRVSTITVPSNFGSNEIQIFQDSVDIGLQNKNGSSKFYRAAGPFQKLMGWFWSSTGVEFTPGQNYTFRVQALPRGLPFYESGCKEGTNVCEGEVGEDQAYSEPILIDWTAPKDRDTRSWFKKFKDWQKHFQIF